MKRLNIAVIALALTAFSCTQDSKPSTTEETSESPNNTVYEPNWESLSKHTIAPEWFQDAKLGIYFHWGVYTVPAFGSEWYASKMYIEGTKEFDHHKKNYGDQKDFGYHQFIPSVHS